MRKVLCSAWALSLALLAASAQERASVTLDPKILEGYAGQYEAGPGGTLTVSLEGGKLYVQPGGQQKLEMFAANAHDFFLKGPPVEFTFHADAQGRATELVIKQPNGDRTARRIFRPTAEGLRPRFAEIDAMAQADFAKRPVGSVTVGVVLGPQLIWTKSYGQADMEKKIAADRDTIYRIGSITKMFTALMLDQLAEAGKVHLSDPAEKYFPELKEVKDRYAGAPPITLIQLATHTAGLSREPANTETYLKGPVAEWEKTLIAALPQTRYIFEPGTRYFYSNIGFAILGAALERAAGEPYVEYVPKHIFQPLGMTHSALDYTAGMAAHLSKGYQAEGPNAIDSEAPQKEHAGRGYKVPNGAIYTTVGDLAHFASFLLDEGPETVLKKASLERVLAQSAIQADANLASGYGPGFSVERRDGYVALGHGGAVAGYQAALYVNRKAGVGVVVLANVLGTPLSTDGLATRVLDMISK
jgi:CubicO group peptidase (beta-lactamase class C family)